MHCHRNSVIHLAFLVLSLFATSSAGAAEDKAMALIQQTLSGGDALGSGVLVQGCLVDRKPKVTMFGKPMKVPAGKHLIGLCVKFTVKPENFLLGAPANYSDVIEFEVTLEAGRSYTATGFQNGTYVEVWMEDANTGKTVSDVAEITVYKCKPLKKCPRPKLNWRSGIY